jgi:hypothetical protein
MSKAPHLITRIKDVKGLTMLVEFDGQDTRAIDLSQLVNSRPTYKKLKDPKVFSQYEITHNGSIVWSRDLEITGPTLYHMGDDSDAPNL